MSLISEISLYFLLSISLGLSLFSILVNPKHTGAGFIKLINNVNLGSVMLILLIGSWQKYLVSLAPAILFLSFAPVFAEGSKKKLYPIFYLGSTLTILWSVGIFGQFNFSYDLFYVFLHALLIL